MNDIVGSLHLQLGDGDAVKVSVEFEELPGWLLGYSSYYFWADPLIILNAGVCGSIPGLAELVVRSLFYQRSCWELANLACPWFPVSFMVEN